MTAYETQLATLTTTQLKEVWNGTENMKGDSIPTVRGWIMDEFEKRDAAGFEAWLESANLEDIKGN